MKRTIVLLAALLSYPNSNAAVLLTAPLKDGTTEVFHVDDTLVDSLPTWSGGPDEPVLSIGSASTIARESLPSDLRHYQLIDVRLSRAWSRASGAIWYYQFSFSDDIRALPPLGVKRVVVLLSGEIVVGEPMTEAQFHELLFRHRPSNKTLESDAD